MKKIFALAFVAMFGAALLVSCTKKQTNPTLGEEMKELSQDNAELIDVTGDTVIQQPDGQTQVVTEVTATPEDVAQ